MHALLKVCGWLAMLCFLVIVEKFIPKQEAAFRTVVAFTWLLWVIVGILYGLRGIWRFMRA